MPPRPRIQPPGFLYSVHPAVAMAQKWVADLPVKTGQTLDEWIALVQEAGPPTGKERRVWLKVEHGLGANIAGWIAERASGGDAGIADDDPERYLEAAVRYVDAMFGGPKAALRPIYDRLLSLGLGLGDDVKACPCTTIVSLYRNHVFAQLKPTTRTRLDLGLALRDTPATGRLIDTVGFAKKDRISHRIPIASLEQIDDEVVWWLTAAYTKVA